MSPTELVPWFQMASTVITGIGVIVSISLGIATLNKNRTERLAKIRPDLMFNIGGQAAAATLSPVRSIPGKDPQSPEIRTFLDTLPEDAKCIELAGGFRQLFNHGEGTAYNISIWFEPDRIKINDEVKRITHTRQTQPPYAKEWNSILCTPPNLTSGHEGSFSILPASVYLADLNTTEVSGTVFIECVDTANIPARWNQPATF